MNKYDEEMCVPSNPDHEDTVAEVIRNNSNYISRLFAIACHLQTFAYGKTEERNVDGQEPHNLREEVRLTELNLNCRNWKKS